ncbi:carotenoid oxygenase family protein [Cryptosporangium arvum]|uniref:Dioxygenase n=1 Tax=Cryptosporangium arvum DSM 44712 TaxID=927661 RepID=A0A011A084_9ACTN|nr:carotenoid oxygenase family protein [Cryptosporangium arvum]EXG82897.1 lignostilbene-alpha,beta-dioxygenase-like enzyme [Cryptosporangium arvum DSM 44712]
MPNPYLAGAHAPVSREITLTDLTITGALPESLTGRYLRNGPNPIGEIDPETYSWFTGDGMVHGVRLRAGRAEWYRNRWVRGPLAASKLGEAERPGSGEAGMDLAGANTNVLAYAGRTLALTEGGITNLELDYDLDTVGPCDFDGTLTGGYTAHPKRDPATGELHAVSYSFARGDQVQYSVIGVDGRARRTVDVTVGGPVMMHDFSLTENYVVLYDLPVTFDLDRAMSGEPGIPYSWKPGYRTRIGVLPREGGDADVRWFDIEACFVFHTLNAYESGDRLVIDLARHPKQFDADDEVDGTISTLERWTVDLRAGTVTCTALDDRHQEFPRIDERFAGRRHRYGYTMALTPGASTLNTTLLRQDLVSGATRSRDFGPGTAIGEFVFEPASPDAPEGHGYLLGFVSRLADDTTELAVLDAETLDPVAAVHLPVRIPTGFHGNWLPDL